MKRVSFLLMLLIGLIGLSIHVGPLVRAEEQKAADALSKVEDGKLVTFNYTVMLPDKTILDSTDGKEPHVYIHGRQHLLPGVEKRLVGMRPGEKAQFTVPAVDAYGPYEASKKFSISRQSVKGEPKVGLIVQSDEGEDAVVVEVTDGTVVLDANHPLAGKDLLFDVTIVKVEPAPSQEGQQTESGEHAKGLSEEHHH